VRMPVFSERTERMVLSDTRNSAWRVGALTLFVLAALWLMGQASASSGVAEASKALQISGEDNATFVERPNDAVETYTGSGIYWRKEISTPMQAAIDLQTQENWEKHRISKESNLGLPLGSVYLKAKNSQYVELAIYERAAFTVFKGKPARQILSSIIFEGRVQVTEDEFINVPSHLRNTFAALTHSRRGKPVHDIRGCSCKATFHRQEQGH
jgi:hypothetical protein